MTEIMKRIGNAWRGWLHGFFRCERPIHAPIKVGDEWVTIETEVNPFRDKSIRITVHAIKEGWVQYGVTNSDNPDWRRETPERRFRNMFKPLQAS